MTGEGPRYERAAQAAAHIMNVIMNANDSPPIRFGKIIYTILDSMDEAEMDLKRLREAISKN